MQFFGISTENIPSVQKASSTSLTWANTNNGTATVVRVGGQAYSPSSTITLNTGTVGFNGIDVGSLAANSLYYIYAVVSSNVMGMIISLAGPATGPAGFTSNFRLLGKLRTDFGGANINTVAMDASIVPQGFDSTPWTSYTPTTSWANVTWTGQKRRVGDTAEYFVKGTLTGTPTATQLTVTTPDGTLNSNVIGLSGIDMVLGVGSYVDTGVNEYSAGIRIAVEDSTKIRVHDSASGNFFTQVVPITWASGDFISLRYSIPIAEWAGLYT